MSASELQDFDIELQLLIDAIYLKYHYDFRGYAQASLRRRMRAALLRFNCSSLSQLQDRVLREPAMLTAMMDFLTVQVSDMFRDPAYYQALRRHVVPMLRTYPSLKIWIAGCSTGEEAYSMAILLREEGLLDRTLIYATDINGQALQKAEAGIYDLDRIAGFTENHRRSGGSSSLSDYYMAAYGRAVFDKSLRRNIVFSDHSLATDSVFAEVQLVSCRNVLIYFNRSLQDRAIGLFRDALCRKGFLGIGAKESLRFSDHSNDFVDVDREYRLYQKKDRAGDGL
ncbi:chemotaxis protein methyltransferase CheR [Hydrocarboniphaga daqingensis]|uniref:Chemotaxis protein methyltransferase CheR n=1 Tax=Hydrocarboniphaga daqingensis TaxID=490188 RepID=A0A1M5PWR1_9GAMM|nr:CheR family methyltransferase [Hydrocarboniphaga daqingensis]SHH05971.1 chemotaxis protein methyltransferase CheR [Hydrocarboniphaga daqingensis]